MGPRDPGPHRSEAVDVYDEDDPEPDVLPGGGWAAHDLSVVAPVVAARPTPTPDDVLRRAVATMLITWRLARGLSQREVARRIGVSQARLSRLERGTVDVSVALLHRVAQLTGSSLVIRITPLRAGRSVRRDVLEGRLGDAMVHVAVDGPSARRSRPGGSTMP
ncbi:helix-turn-helix domain-containing protein [Patulibacter sp.]|uniref:helix-turn-helix domain-containing protein n=1 Tax=Patulibacter sp. TaxID=1912859 RepID=UPI0027248DB6|nr:helix-turn-helix domain-containing protein [Patulibacter sp.]MDO9407050.1 helix-turn-helix domain-containing protein [Patulibacter sp.]